MHRDRLPYILIPVAAFVAILPLLIHGCSCGHDFDFHLLSWMEAARQFAHGILQPHWAYTPAWNAGEPRFVFYPPLSWTIGAILGLIFPWTWTPILYTWLALTAAGLGLNYLARDFTTSKAALIAATLYTVNPYMLFTAYERTAYAELLAAAWIPLLLHAILRDKVTIPRIAIPIALLWLTNAPAAVMSCYALALLTAIRLITNPGAPTQTSRKIARNTIAGTTLGLTLAAFYILPAAYERRFVQIAMAIIPFYRIQDNFLFHHTADLDHDRVLHTASLIAITLILLTGATLTVIRINQNSRTTKLLLPLATITIAITLLLTPITQFVWNHAPELAFLQFPWRLLAILAAVLALAIAIVLKSTNLTPFTTTTLTIAIAATLTYPAYRAFHQPCDKEDTVEARLHLFRSNQGTDPTDEYTPNTADNDSLAKTNPPYWLSPDPNDKAPAGSQPGPAPAHFSIKATQPGYFILNLRDYPSWDITSTDPNSMHHNHPNHIQRDDGLIALPLDVPTNYIIDIAYTRSFDQTTGDILSALALITLLFTLRRKAPGFS
jgi:uncharacterized membrane protein